MTRLWAISLAVLVALVVVLAPAAAPDRKPPRMVAAAMLDADGDFRADRVRIIYSERVRHMADRDGRYPLAVSGYQVRSVGKATGKTLVVLLVEHAEPDPAAAPAIRYRRTGKQPVRDRAGNQALAQLFVKTKAHGNAPPPPAPLDSDGDGTVDANDCAPRDASIHPGAADRPDLGFVDSNCDGIDGAETDAVFVSPDGNDASPGTKDRPKREVQTAVLTAAKSNKRQVLVAFGSYSRIEQLLSGVSVYGGYDPRSWERRDRYPDGLPLISGLVQGVLADGARDVVLQHLAIRGVSFAGTVPAGSAYGIRAINGSSLTLQRVVVSSGDGIAGRPGADGVRGSNGLAGDPGQPGSCDDNPSGFVGKAGGTGGASPTGRTGGRGGNGGYSKPTVVEQGLAGQGGKFGSAGGPGGKNGNPGKPGGQGESGENGTAGKRGAGGQGSTQSAGQAWVGQNGTEGGKGTSGNGGGGGGGGGGQSGLFANNGAGNGAGGGGGGGAGGTGGKGGATGGGSFGIYLFNSKVTIEKSSITAGNGGAGGAGGDGGIGGAGGAGGKGGRVCTSEVGAGGNGGFGGAGGRGGGGGGGAGGPSIGIFKHGASTATLTSSKVTVGKSGAGGAGGSSATKDSAGSAGFPGIVAAIQPQQ